MKILHRTTNAVILEIEGDSLREVDLSGAHLSGANLTDADLHGAELSGADLDGANLYGANLRCANLHGVDLRGADLREANLSETNLNWADLRGAHLRFADLSETDLTGADLAGADLTGAHLREAYLSGAKQRIVRIVGTQHEITAIDSDVWIGCARMPISRWLSDGRVIAKKNNYTETEIAEYFAYLELIQRVLAINPVKKEAEHDLGEPEPDRCKLETREDVGDLDLRCSMEREDFER